MAHAHLDAPRAAPSETLAGTVERVTFHNTENGFVVLNVKARGKRDLITVVGHAAAISAGEFITAGGACVSDRTHGLQFKGRFWWPGSARREPLVSWAGWAEQKACAKS